MPSLATLRQIYTTLLKEYGSQNWWPADTPFEVMLGAILTQNTAWSSVERALEGLGAVAELTPAGILDLSPDKLEEAIRPSGYFRQKARRLRILCGFLVEEYGGSTHLMKPVPTTELRRQLLGLHGIGPETADSILLYALQRSVFVVDSYTARLFSRLGICSDTAGYDELQAIFMDRLEPDADLFNEYHALIVVHGKDRCRKANPLCESCPLLLRCEPGSRFQPPTGSGPGSRIPD